MLCPVQVRLCHGRLHPFTLRVNHQRCLERFQGKVLSAYFSWVTGSKVSQQPRRDPTPLHLLELVERCREGFQKHAEHLRRISISWWGPPPDACLHQGSLLCHLPAPVLASSMSFTAVTVFFSIAFLVRVHLHEHLIIRYSPFFGRPPFRGSHGGFPKQDCQVSQNHANVCHEAHLHVTPPDHRLDLVILCLRQALPRLVDVVSIFIATDVLPPHRRHIQTWPSWGFHLFPCHSRWPLCVSPGSRRSSDLFFKFAQPFLALLIGPGLCFRYLPLPVSSSFRLSRTFWAGCPSPWR